MALIARHALLYARTTVARPSGISCGATRHSRTFVKQSGGLLDYKPGGIATEELDELLAKPTWSVESLLPPKDQAPDAPKVSSQQLHHLLRLSALPPPSSLEEERKMLDTLSAQLHFVGEIQQVDTIGVKPLRAIRDETRAAEKEQTVTLDALKEALAQEQVIGQHYRRVQRKTEPVDAKEVEEWDVLGSAERKVGQYFVVDSERPQE
jgi:Asp-tRNA(Asn)/Glu-tRNA(Gln) amidotransferase C subunit